MKPWLDAFIENLKKTHFYGKDNLPLTMHKLWKGF
jgi:hypothetical protein